MQLRPQHPAAARVRAGPTRTLRPAPPCDGGREEGGQFQNNFLPFPVCGGRTEAGLVSRWGARGWVRMEKAKRCFHQLSPKGATRSQALAAPRIARHPPAPGPRGAPARTRLVLRTGSAHGAFPPRTPGGRTRPTWAGTPPAPPASGGKEQAGGQPLAPTCLFQARAGEGPGRALGGAWRGRGGNLQCRGGRRVGEGAVDRKKSPPVSGEECEGGGTGRGIARGAEVKCQAAGGQHRNVPGQLATCLTGRWRVSSWHAGPTPLQHRCPGSVITRTRVSGLGRASARLTSTCPCARPLSLCQARRGQTTLPFSAPGSYGGGEGRRRPCRPSASLCPPGGCRGGQD